MMPPLFSKKKTLYNLIALFLFYINVILTFALIYWALDLSKLGPIVDHYSSFDHQNNWIDGLFRYLYFSAITYLQWGNGLHARKKIITISYGTGQSND